MMATTDGLKSRQTPLIFVTSTLPAGNLPQGRTQPSPAAVTWREAFVSTMETPARQTTAMSTHNTGSRTPRGTCWRRLWRPREGEVSGAVSSNARQAAASSP